MPQTNLPLSELGAAVQSAVDRVLAKHGAVSIDKLWVGFVAPDKIATLDMANKLASEISRAGNIQGAGSIAQLTPSTGAGHTEAEKALPKPGHLIGVIYAPHQQK